MRLNRNILRTGLLVSCVALLAGCQTMEQSMTNVRERIASIDLSKAKFWESDNTSESVDALTAAENSAQIAYSQSDECPNTKVIDELGLLYQFENPDFPKPHNNISSIAVTKLDAKCSINSTNLVADLDIHFDGKLGPKARAHNSDRPSFAYPYFLAVVDDKGKIVSKEIFAAPVSYQRNMNVTSHHENIRQVIPLGTYKKASDYTLLVGFQLSEAELAYNRSVLDIRTAGSIEPSPGPHPVKYVDEKQIGTESEYANKRAPYHPSLQMAPMQPPIPLTKPPKQEIAVTEKVVIPPAIETSAGDETASPEIVAEELPATSPPVNVETPAPATVTEENTVQQLAPGVETMAPEQVDVEVPEIENPVDTGLMMEEEAEAAFDDDEVIDITAP